MAIETKVKEVISKQNLRTQAINLLSGFQGRGLYIPPL